MKNVWVLMTAMPPTQGHAALIQYAYEYARTNSKTLNILLCTQPHEPYSYIRGFAIRRLAENIDPDIVVHHFTKAIEQNPEAPGFWDMWYGILESHGAQKGDVYVASEIYGAEVAELMQGKYVPFDPYREIFPIKATATRQSLLERWDDIIPEFSEYLTTRVTIFGAESTGKTTLAKTLAKELNGHFLFEWARPYLETVKNEITVETMTDIWKGQEALQNSVFYFPPRPFIFYDTDLFSTLGYWQFPHWAEHLGEPPVGLIDSADQGKSDLYIVTKSDIPFEEDPLRYGGDKREGSDEYWINVCKDNNLNYVVLDAAPEDRFAVAKELCVAFFEETTAKLREYDRGGF